MTGGLAGIFQSCRALAAFQEQRSLFTEHNVLENRPGGIPLHVAVGQPFPNVSTLNTPSGQAVANAAIPAGPMAIPTSL
jgi:hypothetical protein